MNITLEQLENLLNQQRELVIDRLLHTSSYWNGDSKPGHQLSVNIVEDRFIETGRKTPLPEDVMVLKRYLNKSE